MTMERHSSLYLSIPILRTSSRELIPSFLSISYSTGRPWVSHPKRLQLGKGSEEVRIGGYRRRCAGSLGREDGLRAGDDVIVPHDMKSGHRCITSHDILNGSGQNMPVMRETGREGRPVIEDVLWLSFGPTKLLVESIDIIPELQVREMVRKRDNRSVFGDGHRSRPPPSRMSILARIKTRDADTRGILATISHHGRIKEQHLVPVSSP